MYKSVFLAFSPITFITIFLNACYNLAKLDYKFYFESTTKRFVANVL